MSTKQLRVISIVLISLCLSSQVSTVIVPESGSSCCGDNTVLVSGEGKVSVQPDIAIVTVGVSVTAKTSL